MRCFEWLIYLGKAKNGELLARWSMLQAGNETKCKFCGLAQESLDHLFLHCTFVWEVWVDCLSWWGVQWVLPSNIIDFFRWWKSWRYRGIKKQIWECMPLVVIWTVWFTRNEIFFQGTNPAWSEIGELIKVRTALWVRSTGCIKITLLIILCTGCKAFSKRYNSLSYFLILIFLCVFFILYPIVCLSTVGKTKVETIF